LFPPAPTHLLSTHPANDAVSTQHGPLASLQNPPAAIRTTPPTPHQPSICFCVLVLGFFFGVVLVCVCVVSHCWVFCVCFLFFVLFVVCGLLGLSFFTVCCFSPLFFVSCCVLFARGLFRFFCFVFGIGVVGCGCFCFVSCLLVLFGWFGGHPQPPPPTPPSERRTTQGLGGVRCGSRRWLVCWMGIWVLFGVGMKCGRWLGYILCCFAWVGSRVAGSGSSRVLLVSFLLGAPRFALGVWEVESLLFYCLMVDFLGSFLCGGCGLCGGYFCDLVFVVGLFVVTWDFGVGLLGCFCPTLVVAYILNRFCLNPVT